jgi:hypothetical protein
MRFYENTKKDNSGVNALIETKEPKEPIDNTSNIVKFPDGYSMEVHPARNGKVLYILKDPKNRDVAKDKGEEPLMIGEQSKIGRKIKQHIDQSLKGSPKFIEEFEMTKMALNERYQLQLIALENESEAQQREDAKKHEENIKIARDLLESKDQPLLYIASLVSWLTAGERANIILAFIAYASQVILRNPINVVILGEGGSGKTHIETEALKLIPSRYVIKEKKTTDAAFFDRGLENPYVYDGKIVSFGDLGGESSQEFVMEIKDLLKELQTDGYLSKTMIGKDHDGERMRVQMELFGHPCTTYTTVPGHEFDDQEMSRSIFITPRMDNKDVFHAMKKMLEFNGGRTYKQFQYYSKELEIVKYIVYVLRERMETVIINNPYTESVIKFLGESEYFKRDFDKYNGILKTITAINGYNRQTFEIDGQEILYTSLNDIKLFMSLLKAYHESISVNISPKSAEVLDDIRGQIDEWIMDRKIPDMGTFTVNDYMELSGTHLSKKSVQTYFGELNRTGFIKVVGHESRANVYQLSGRVSDSLEQDLLTLSEEQKQLIEWELGSNAVKFILEDVVMDGLTIHLHDPCVDVPGWDRYDEVKQ